MNLKELKIGESAVITEVGGEGALRQHFLDMGVIPGAYVTVVKLAPLGDPMEIRIHGYELTMRLAEAEQITVDPNGKTTEPVSAVKEVVHASHPGLGEDGKYHNKKEEHPLPEGTTLTFALVGNQNSGKTTLFNQLTGSNQHVGNFPGVTVDRKDGVIKGHPDTLVTDLPGIYSMSPYSAEEIVSRNFVIEEKPKTIINIVDATNIERNLYLTMQLLEMNIPMVVALNMMDEVTGNKGAVDINLMEEMLGVPVVPIAALRNQGVDELVEHAVHIARYQEKPQQQDFCSKEDMGGAVHRAIHAVQAIIEDHAERACLPLRFAATKILENDPLVQDMLKLDDNEKEMIEHIVIQMEKEGGLDRNAAVAAMRFRFIDSVCRSAVRKPVESKERLRSEKIDAILTGKWTALPCFILIMGLVFWLTFNVIGAFLQDQLAAVIGSLADVCDGWLISAGVNEAVHDLVIKGIFEGVGSVLSFLPIVVTLFFFLSMLEDSGYLARIAFVMDKLLRRIGLSGRSIVPMLIGFGCTVPAVMSTRTLPSKRDRMMTILLTPFMSCTAKLPIYGFFANSFFPHQAGWIMIGLYVLGIVTAVLCAYLFKNTLFKGEAVPFVMELPNYRMPGLKNVMHLLWEKASDFLTRAFSVIFVATIVVWFLQSFDMHLNYVTDSSLSIMSSAAGVLEGLFRPIGLGDWRIITALISGFMAKESVVATLQVLLGNNITSVLTPLSAAAVLIFSLLYTPCVAAVASIRRELGSRWAIGTVIWQCSLAWVITFLLRFVLMAFGLS
ncbi:MAG: ferrous iron transport protein B [Solobacterium sp.]|nr:ferrous iron transport protein B [Solobacterium sp.]